jgi:predicted nicotinamide N-methyase
VPIWKKTEEELGAIKLPSPFWAFAWAGRQAPAHYVLDNPARIGDGRVLDFASGSGLVAVSAALAGAQGMEASDVDTFAVAAIELNTVGNGVVVTPRLEDLVGTDETLEARGRRRHMAKQPSHPSRLLKKSAEKPLVFVVVA